MIKLGKTIAIYASAALAITACTTPDAKAHKPATQKAAAPQVTYKTTDLGAGIYMLEGRGGNVGFSVGADGILVIDDQFGNNVEGVIAQIRKISDAPISYVLNTHWHGDHAGGNEAMHKEGAMIVAHDNVRLRMKSGGTIFGRNVPASPAVALPTLTFSHSQTFHWNEHEIHLFHSPNSHTDGDALIHFRDANVIHTGDTFFALNYPFIDLSSGGSIDGFIATLKQVASIADDETKIIPGHGPLSTKQDIETMIEVMSEARATVQTLLDQGKSEADIIALDPLKTLSETYGQGFINGERMTTIIIKSLSK